LDTRSKILDWDHFAAAAAAAPIVVIGHFDPLLAEHAEELDRLAAVHGPLYVAVTEPPGPVLPAAVRAELVAALRAVASVAVAAGPVVHSGRISIEAADLERRRSLTAQVQSRRQSTAKP
jgi:hypothetical protein